MHSSAAANRELAPAGSSLRERVEPMLALLRTGRLADARAAFDQITVAALESSERDPTRAALEVAGAAGAVAAIVGAMRQHANDLLLQRFGCTALTSLCARHARNAARAGAAGAVDAVLRAAALVGTTNDPEDKAGPWQALGALSEEDARIAAAAVAAGALERVIADMRAHPGSAALQTMCCMCIQQLIKDDASAILRAIESGGMEAVLQTLRLHGSNSQVCGWACGALGMFYDEISAVEASAHARAQVSAVVAALLKALNAHRTEEGLIAQVFTALFGIMSIECTRRAAATVAGAVPSVLAALQAHPGSENMQSYGVGVLAHVCINSGPNVAAAVAAGAPEHVLAAMATYPGNGTLQCEGCLALNFFMDAASAVTLAQRRRAAAAVVGAMRTHGSMPLLQNNGCGALHTIAGSAECLASVRAAGGVEVVVSALHSLRRRAFEADPPEQLASTIVLTLVSLVTAARDDDANTAAQDAAVRAGALEPVDEATPSALSDGLFARLKAVLANAARRHDAAPCAHAAACKRCAAARARGKMCVLPSCSVRKRVAEDGTPKKLLRCARCKKATYCCREHQKADWPTRHKAECDAWLAGGSSASRTAESLAALRV
jgi:hypothetical protein